MGKANDMVMQKILVQVPKDLARRLKRRIPARKRSAFVQHLLEQALPPDEDDDPLYLAAVAVQQDEKLAQEMAEWDATVGDGLAHEATRR